MRALDRSFTCPVLDVAMVMVAMVMVAMVMAAMVMQHHYSTPICTHTHLRLPHLHVNKLIDYAYIFSPPPIN